MHILRLAIVCFLCVTRAYTSPFSAALLPSTESDPDTFIHHCFNAITGDYCETVTDLVITGPDALVLQRFYNARDYFTGQLPGGWRFFPHAHLQLIKGKETKQGHEQVYAIVGERSGGILTYSGWRKANGETADPLKIDVDNDGIGIVNTYSGEMNGRTNHRNNRLSCNQDTCTLITGDGTHRLYQRFKQEHHREFFHLVSEILPSGNTILFSYDEKDNVTCVEMKNASQQNLHAWMRFSYTNVDGGSLVMVSTSDSRTLFYRFEKMEKPALTCSLLKEVTGSHCIPCTYDYKVTAEGCWLTRKNLPEGRFLEIEYDRANRVSAFREPSTTSGNSEVTGTFSYGNGVTEWTNAAGYKTRYLYDERLQLTTVERYDQQAKLYRVDRKYWGKSPNDRGLLLAKSIEDHSSRILSYRSFQYDPSGNVIEERLYGNLTGKQEVILQVDQNGLLVNADRCESHVKTYGYSDDSYNLLIWSGDCKDGKTTYRYRPNSNLLLEKNIKYKSQFKQTLYAYNEDAVCIQVVETDDSECHLIDISPKATLPGVGLPLEIKEKAIGLRQNKDQELLIKRLVHTYSDQGQLLKTETFDATNTYAHTSAKTYNERGLVASETAINGEHTFYGYDGCGNQTLVKTPNKQVETRYDYRNQPIRVEESAGDYLAIQEHIYDVLGRKISSTDRFGQTTQFEYDAFGRLTKVIYPTVLDENAQDTQPTFSYTYDCFGNITTLTDPKGYVTEKIYTIRGDPLLIKYPDGSYERFKYDSEGSLHRSLSRNQIATTYAYDFLGRVYHETLSTLTDKGSVSAFEARIRDYNAFHITSRKDHHLFTHYTHDLAGRVTKVIEYDEFDQNKLERHRQNHRVDIAYDSLGRVCKKTTWAYYLHDDVVQTHLKPETYFSECSAYDLSGNVIERRVEDAKGQILLSKRFTYDSMGNCIEEYTLQDGQKKLLLATEYDSFGDPISYTDAEGNHTQILIDYQRSTLRKTLVNPLGVQTTMDFDALGRLTTITKKDPSDTLLSLNTILYDAVGNKASEAHARIRDGQIQEEHRTRWVYGPMGRLDALIEAEGTPEEKRTTYGYNTLGQLISKSSENTSIRYTYNTQGQLTKVEGVNGSAELSFTYRYEDRKSGPFIEAFDNSGRCTRRTYDVWGNLLRETFQGTQEKYGIDYQYDHAKRLTKITLPDQSTIQYRYDALFPREVQRYTRAGALYRHTYDTYDALGQLTEETLIGKCGRRKTQWNATGKQSMSQTDFFCETSSYDSLGRLVDLQYNHPSQQSSAHYDYNSLSQVSHENSLVEKTYAHDSLDNCWLINNQELQTNGLNQLIAKDQATYSYDAQGNLLRKILDGEETLFKHNALSQLISLEHPSHSRQFHYDPFGRRILTEKVDRQTGQRSVACHFYCGSQYLGSIDKDGNIQQLRVPGITGNSFANTSVLIEIGRSAFVPLHNTSGHVIALAIPSTKQIVERYAYSAFGEETIYNTAGEILTHSSVGNPWRYADKPIDEQTGLIDFGARDYDPSIGRWIDPDPLGYADGPNPYAYLHNNPINNYDRFGFATQSQSTDAFNRYFAGDNEPYCPQEKCHPHRRGGDNAAANQSRLPTISYLSHEESIFPKPAKVLDLGLEDQSDIGIGFVNGIWTSETRAIECAEYLSRLADGSNIHLVHNPNNGKLHDLLECLLGLNYIATDPVRQIHVMWNSYFEKNSAKANFLTLCVSQGAIHVRNALLDYSPELRRHIFVVAIAPAAYIYQKSCAEVWHYRAPAWRDFVPRIDQAGAIRSKRTIRTLNSHPNAPLFDHDFMSPTYKSALQSHLLKYIETQGQEL